LADEEWSKKNDRRIAETEKVSQLLFQNFVDGANSEMQVITLSPVVL
jgi:hypothetical protein